MPGSVKGVGPDGLPITGPAGGLDVNIQDQTTRPLFLPFAEETATITTLTSPTVVDTKVVNVTDETGFSAGDFVGIFGGSFYFGTVISTAAGVLNVDSPLDFAFPTSGSIVQKINIEMNVDGTTPKTFSVRGADLFDYDITRILLFIVTSDPIDFNGFADAPTPLTQGIVFRRRNGLYENYWNIKNNVGFIKVAYDVTRYSATSPQDVDALSMRLTLAGQSKIGVVVRLSGQDDRLEIIIQDNLSATGVYDITSFQIIAEGHIVD